MPLHFIGASPLYLIRAYEISKQEYPVARHLEAIQALVIEFDEREWDWGKAQVLRDIEIYLGRGMELGSATTLNEIQDANKLAMNTIGHQFGALGLLSLSGSKRWRGFRLDPM